VINLKIVKYVCFFVFCCMILSGCGNKNSDDILKELDKKISNLSSYRLSGVLEIINGENNYLYDVDVSFLKDNNFRVSLKNQTNNHEQIILRNSDGVYVLTPSLNKSFKFQSEWPYNNSQTYLLHNLLNDIKGDSDSVFDKTSDGYIITTKVNYSNNKDLINQKIYLDNDSNIKCVEVFDSNGLVKMKMSISSIDYNCDFDSNYFKLDNNMSVSVDLDNFTSKIGDVLYPMYIPQNTYLSSQDKVSIQDGERIIMTFSGDYPFMLIQETLNSDSSLISVSGEPLQLVDSIGIIDDSSITWIDGGVEYYLVSNVLEQNQLIDVAKSLSVASIQK